VIVHVTVNVSPLPTVTVGLSWFSANTLSKVEVVLVLFIRKDPLIVVPAVFRLLNAKAGDVSVNWLYVPAVLPAVKVVACNGAPSFAVAVKIKPSAELALLPPIFVVVAVSEPLRLIVPEPLMSPITLNPPQAAVLLTESP